MKTDRRNGTGKRLAAAGAAGILFAGCISGPGYSSALLGGVSSMLQQKEDGGESVSEEDEPVWEDETETETEIDWSVYAPDGGEDTFSLDTDYIASYGGEYCSDIIFYGDSRVVGMSRSIGGCHYVGREGAGYDWMQGEGLPYLEGQMRDNPEADVVFCFGVNDPGNIENYIRFFESFLEKYPERRSWFLSVNPVYDGLSAANGYNADNAGIDLFNSRLEEAFPDRYIDSSGYLTEYGYNAPDGVHYDGDTYFAIQNYCWRVITEKIEES